MNDSATTKTVWPFLWVWAVLGFGRALVVLAVLRLIFFIVDESIKTKKSGEDITRKGGENTSAEILINVFMKGTYVGSGSIPFMRSYKPVVREIEVPHAARKDEIRRKPRSHT